MSSNETFQSLAAMEADLEAHDYVMGRMGPEARRAFEARLENNPALAEAVAEERALADALARRPEASIPASAFEQLGPSLPQRKLSLRALTAVAAALGLITLAISLAPAPQPQFRTLSEPASALENPLAVRVVFAESADSEARAALAQRYGFLLLGGPEASGAYLVESVAPVDATMLARWRADPGILFAEPAQQQAP